MKLNERLAKLRKNYNYSTRDLAAKLGVSQSSISLWESGDRKPDYEKIVKLSELYGVSVDYLLGNNNELNHEKSMYLELNELRNDLLFQMERLRGQEMTLNKKIEWMENELRIDRSFIKTKESNYAQLPTDLGIDDESEKEFIKELIKKSKERENEIVFLQGQRDEIRKEIENLQIKSNSVFDEYKRLKEKNKRVSTLANRLSHKQFKNMDINSEEELQIAVITYLGLYETYKKSNLSAGDFMKKVSVAFDNSDKNKFDFVTTARNKN